jgi:hypothetical protein
MGEIFLQGNILRTTTNALRSYRGFVHLLIFYMAFTVTLSNAREELKKNSSDSRLVRSSIKYTYQYYILRLLPIY